jgi:predicted AAA+ superfamily ATPase
MLFVSSNRRDKAQAERLSRPVKHLGGTTGDREIDFTARKNGKTVYLQVCCLLASPEAAEREFSALAMPRDNFPKYVLSLDEFDLGRDGIKHLNIRDFLSCVETL